MIRLSPPSTTTSPQSHHHRHSLLIHILLITSLTFLLITSATASFDSTTHFRGPFIRRYGLANCPDNLSFETSVLSLTPSQLIANGQECTSGKLTLQKSSQTDTFAPLSAYLAAQRGVGDAYVAEVLDLVECQGVVWFSDRAVMVFFKPTQDISVSWERVFSRNDTKLHIATGRSAFLFKANVSYVVINSICLYSGIRQDEFQAQLGEACFPAASQVTLANGQSRNVDRLQIGDHVSTYSQVTQVIGWTHWKPISFTRFKRLHLANGGILTASSGHFVYVSDGSLKRMQDIQPGYDTLHAINGTKVLVLSSEWVWRIGLYNPQTRSGDLMVDGWRCSTYTHAVVDASVGHALLAPVRALWLISRGIDVLRWTHLFEDERKVYT